MRGRDVAIGIVLAFSVGLGVLFLKLYTKRYATEVFTILGVSHRDVVLTLVLGILALMVLGVMYRPLLFALLDPEVVAARGVPVRLLSMLFLLLLALAAAQAVQVVGVLLIFVLLVAPPATAQYLTHRPGRAALLTAVLALLETWLGITAAYYWSKLPVSFCIATPGCGLYIVARLAAPLLTPGRSRGHVLEASERFASHHVA